jgi:hypothetical protein
LSYEKDTLLVVKPAPAFAKHGKPAGLGKARFAPLHSGLTARLDEACPSCPTGCMAGTEKTALQANQEKGCLSRSPAWSGLICAIEQLQKPEPSSEERGKSSLFLKKKKQKTFVFGFRVQRSGSGV